MRFFLLRICLQSALLAGCLVGCQSTPKAPPYPADPLFVSKKPQEAKTENADPVLVADAAPDEPPVPAAVLAARQAPRGPVTRPGFLPETGEYRVGYPPAASSP